MENEVDTINLPRKEDLLAWLAWLVPVIFLMLWDVWKAWKRRAPWIPGQALLLSAFITELLFFIDCSHITVDSGSRYQTEEVEAILVKNQLVIDSGRVMMCVLIAYLLPGMARSGSIAGGSNLAALALSITFHVVSEFRSHWKVEKRNESLNALAASSFAIILNLAIIYLLLLLIHAAMIDRTIRRFISQKIPLAISCCCTPCDRPRYNDTKDHVPSASSCCTTSCGGPKCKDIKDHILKCWIVVRLCQPDYVLSRSSLCSTLWPTVTTCFGFYIINWIYIYNESLNSVTKGTLVQLVITGQIVIVVIGWIVLLVRWVTSDRQGNISGEYYIYGMSLEDLQARFIGLFVWDRRIQERITRDMNRKFRVIQSLLWNPPHWLSIIKQKLPKNKTLVSASVSKAEVDDDQFSKYEETLNMLLIPGESALKLWKANRWGFRKVERYMNQGQKDGECSPSELTDGECSPVQLISLLERGTAEGEAGKSAKEANKNSWKRTAVSLIHFMIYFYDDGLDAYLLGFSSHPYDGGDASVIEDAMQCYIQAWEYMNFVDGLNEEVKSLGRQADREFESLQHSWNKRAQPGRLEREIKQPLRQLRHQLESRSDEERRNLQNSKDSTEVAKYCLFETWTVMDPYLLPLQFNPRFHFFNEINWLQSVLANVYVFYMKEDLKEAVLQKCHKLAEEGMEEEILDVAFLAAKAQGVLDKVGKGNDPKDPVELPHNTDQGSTSSPIPTEIELVGEGIRSRRPNDSLTDQTEIAVADEDNDSWDSDKEKLE